MKFVILFLIIINIFETYFKIEKLYLTIKRKLEKIII